MALSKYRPKVYLPAKRRSAYAMEPGRGRVPKTPTNGSRRSAREAARIHCVNLQDALNAKVESPKARAPLKTTQVHSLLHSTAYSSGQAAFHRLSNHGRQSPCRRAQELHHVSAIMLFTTSLHSQEPKLRHLRRSLRPQIPQWWLPVGIDNVVTGSPGRHNQDRRTSIYRKIHAKRRPDTKAGRTLRKLPIIRLADSQALLTHKDRQSPIRLRHLHFLTAKHHQRRLRRSYVDSRSLSRCSGNNRGWPLPRCR